MVGALGQEGLTVGIHCGNRQATGRKLWVATSKLHRDREDYARRPLVNPHGEAAGEEEEEAWASFLYLVFCVSQQADKTPSLPGSARAPIGPIITASPPLNHSIN